MKITTILDQATIETPSAPSRLLKDNVTIGNWQILALVGKGGNGEVYRVRHIKSGAIGALKAFLDLNQIRRFELEVEILRKMTCSSPKMSRRFPRLLDSGTIPEANVPYVVMEFLHELTLPTQDADVAKLIFMVGEAIRELHNDGYLHRDVKPENLMMRENGEVVLIDFGLAKRIKDIENPLTERVSRVGTDGSTAPEQMHGHASVKSDVYALGSLASDCFRGNPPTKWVSIIQKAINPKDEFRFNNIDEFLIAVKRRTRPSRWIIIGGCVLICAMAGLIIAFAMLYLKAKKVESGEIYDDARNPKIRAQYIDEARATAEEARATVKQSIDAIKAELQHNRARP